MKSLKKLLLGLATLAVAAVAFSLFSGHHALADSPVYPKLDQICVPKYTPAGDSDHHTVAGWLSVSFRDRAHLVATYHPQGACASPSGYNDLGFFGQSSFSDIFKNISGQANTLYLYDGVADSNVSYNSPVGSSGADDPIINGFGSNLDNIMQDGLGGHDQFVSAADLQSALTATEIHLGLESDKTGYVCSDVNADSKSDNFVLVDGNPPHWRCIDNGGISGLKGLVLGPNAFTNLDNFNISYTVQTDGSGNTTLQPVFENERGSRTLTWCPNVTATGAFVNNACTGSIKVQATIAQINALGNGYGNFTMSQFDGSNAFPIRVAGADTAQATANAAGNGNTDTSAESGTSDTCTNKSAGFELGYIFCPLLNIAQTMTDHLEGLFEGQLSFTIKSIDTNGQAKIYKSWSIFRDIASSVLVIVMLMMVISQALGTEAYAVKKMLPRLVIATILMQISYQLFSIIVSIFDDVGHGLAFLMYYPFGGEGNMGLRQLLDNANIGGSAQFGINWVATGALIFAANAWLGPVLAFAFGAVLALLTGVAVLIFRKLLILLLLILVPLALIAWTFPGQSMQGYWKKWYDNFLKTLMMYPLLIALIAAGRILAYVAGNTGGGTFLNLLIILVGFFGPLFILPKTYKWGGSLMSSAGSWMDNLQRSASKAAAPGLKGFAESTFTGKRSDQYDPTLGKFAIGRKKFLGKYGPAIMPDFKGRTWRRVQSGHFLPTNRSRNLTLQRGEKWSGERTAEALAYEQKVERTYQAKGIDKNTADKWNTSANKYLRKTGYLKPGDKDLKIFTPKEPGSGAGKWSALGLFWQAYQKGDSSLQKAIADRLIDSKSGLEFRNKNFIAPYFDPEEGKMVLTPMFHHPMTLDREYKEPNRYAIMGQLGGDMPVHNTPYGGKGGQKASGYQGTYRRGIRYINDNGVIKENPEWNPDIAEEFGLTRGQRRDDAVPSDYTFKNGEYRPVPTAAHYAQASYDDARNNIAMGGSMGGAFLSALTEGAETGFIVGEPPNPMPARQASWVVADSVKDQAGRDNMKVILTDPSTREGVEKMFKAAGVTHFSDRFGGLHEMSVKNLWDVNVRDEQRIKEGETPTVSTREQTLYTSDASGNPRPLYGHAGPAPAPVGRNDFGNNDEPSGERNYMPTRRDPETGYVEPVPRDAPRYSSVAPAPAAAAPVVAAPPREASTGLLHDSGAAPAAQASGGGVVFDRNLEQRLDELTGAIRHQTVEGRKTREAISNMGSDVGRPIRSGPEWPSEGPPTGANPPGEGPDSE